MLHAFSPLKCLEIVWSVIWLFVITACHTWGAVKEGVEEALGVDPSRAEPGFSSWARDRYPSVTSPPPPSLHLVRKSPPRTYCLSDHHGCRRLHQIHQVPAVFLQLHLLGEQPGFSLPTLCFTVVPQRRLSLAQVSPVKIKHHQTSQIPRLHATLHHLFLCLHVC